MELKVEMQQIPGAISFNYAELKEELLQKVNVYQNLVYTEDQIQLAKTDRANLNRLKKALNDERIRQEREYMKPFQEFKTQVSELVKIVDSAAAAVDKSVKEFEEQKKREKESEICVLWEKFLSENLVPAGICFKSVFDEKWLNTTFSMKTIEKAISEKLEKAGKDLEILESVDYPFEAKEIYFETMDLQSAIFHSNELKRIAERKAAYEAQRAEREKVESEAAANKRESVHYSKPAEENTLLFKSGTPAQWIGFAALLTIEEAVALRDFFEKRNIQFRKLDI